MPKSWSGFSVLRFVFLCCSSMYSCTFRLAWIILLFFMLWKRWENVRQNCSLGCQCLSYFDDWVCLFCFLRAEFLIMLQKPARPWVFLVFSHKVITIWKEKCLYRKLGNFRWIFGLCCRVFFCYHTGNTVVTDNLKYWKRKVWALAGVSNMSPNNVCSLEIIKTWQSFYPKAFL